MSLQQYPLHPELLVGTLSLFEDLCRTEVAVPFEQPLVRAFLMPVLFGPLLGQWMLCITVQPCQRLASIGVSEGDGK